MNTKILSFHYHFHVLRHYFECHDILEEHWKEQPNYTKKDPIVSLILFSTACYHYRRNNLKGALKTYSKSLLIAKEDNSFEHLGIDKNNYTHLIETQINRIKENNPYEIIHLPLTEQCLQMLLSTYHDFDFRSDIHISNYIRNYHLLRDRTDVVNSRALAYNLRHPKQ